MRTHKLFKSILRSSALGGALVSCLVGCKGGSGDSMETVFDSGIIGEDGPVGGHHQ
ncbi:MAG: hypothetical protein GY811_03885 [Myxococcales bacterium]|nr:hypothetical protein [Myxococcales bacterium]